IVARRGAYPSEVATNSRRVPTGIRSTSTGACPTRRSTSALLGTCDTTSVPLQRVAWGVIAIDGEGTGGAAAVVVVAPSVSAPSGPPSHAGRPIHTVPSPRTSMPIAIAPTTPSWRVRFDASARAAGPAPSRADEAAAAAAIDARDGA